METVELRRRRLAQQLLETRKQLCNNTSPYAPRSLQIDFASIDDEYRTDIVKQIINVLNIFPNWNFSIFANDVRLLLDLTVFFYTVWQDLPTPGQGLLGLEYSNLKNEKLSKTQKAKFLAGSVLVPYLFSKFASFVYRDHPVERSYMQRLRLLHRLLDGSYKCLSLTNLLLFLYKGRFRDLSERFCEIVCKSVKRNVSRQEMEWDFINQELLWHEFSEALLLLLPFLGSRLTIDQFRFFKKSKLRYDEFILNVFSVDKLEREQAEEKCPACFSQDVQNPFACVPCGHVYCYYCIASRIASNQKFKTFHCLKCNVKVEAIKRLGLNEELANKKAFV